MKKQNQTLFLIIASILITIISLLSSIYELMIFSVILLLFPCYILYTLIESQEIKNKLIYSKDLYIPTNIRYNPLFTECKKLNITYERLPQTRCFRFFCEDESNIRYIQTKNVLKNC